MGGVEKWILFFTGTNIHAFFECEYIFNIITSSFRLDEKIACYQIDKNIMRNFRL